MEAARAPIVLFVAGRERKRRNCAWRLLPFLRAAAQVHWIRVFLSPGPPACARGDGRERGARLSAPCGGARDPRRRDRGRRRQHRRSASLTSDTVPCRYGKLREKIFFGLPRRRKSRAIIDLGHDYGKNRRRGREPAGKPQNPRIAAWHHPIMANITIR